MIKLTSLSTGRPVYVNCRNVQYVYTDEDGQTNVIFAVDSCLTVREEAEKVAAHLSIRLA